jgi:Domain of unknown function (DUF222)
VARLSVGGLCLTLLMQAIEGIDELGEAGILDRLDVLHANERRTQAEVLLLAVQFAVLHDEHTLDPGSRDLDGREKAIRFGGEGTPLVTEFCAADFGARLQLTPYAARQLIGDALDLRHRLPQLWRRVQALEVKVSYARHVARKTRDLTREQAAYVDARVAESADGRITWSRFEALVEGAIAAADPEAAAERERQARAETFARPTRSTEDGMRGFYVRAHFAVIARLDATVDHLAEALKALGVNLSEDQRRALAVLVLANPHQAVRVLDAYHQQRTGSPPDPAELLPEVMIHVHTYRGPDPTTGIVRVEGVGPVTEAWVREFLGPQARFRIQQVVDLEGQAPVDGYEIPDRHRQAVHLMTPADTFPFASNTTRSKQIDHTVPYQHGAERPNGQSGLGNYGPMTTFHHRIKTFGKWTLKQPFPGIYLWRDPHGALYLVDHTGTRRLGRVA